MKPGEPRKALNITIESYRRHQLQPMDASSVCETYEVMAVLQHRAAVSACQESTNMLLDMFQAGWALTQASACRTLWRAVHCQQILV